MQVFDDDERRRVRASVLGQPRGERLLAALARAVVHGLVDGLPFGALREVEEVVQKYDLLGLDDAFGRDLRGGGLPCLTRCTGRQAEQAADDGSHRVLALADAEIEHEASMQREALGLRMAAHLVDEPRLADPGFASHMNDVPRALCHARMQDAVKLFELGFASDEMAVARPDRLAAERDEAPWLHRRVDALEAPLADCLATGDIAERARRVVG
ncbi:hypothetical protein QFZ97_008047 [Paraburkholderia youngii]